MTIRNHIISFIVALVAGGMIPLCAADGSTAYNFLNITSSSRIYGLGGVNISIVDDDINSIDQNPGLLGPEVGKQLGLNYMHYVGDAILPACDTVWQPESMEPGQPGYSISVMAI